MTIRDYIKDIYRATPDNLMDIYFQDPLKIIAERDDIPYDAIESVDGILQKVIYLSDDTPEPVIDMLSYTPAYAQKIYNEADFKIWQSFSDKVALTDVDMFEITKLRENIEASQRKKRGMLDNVPNNTN